MTVTNRHPDLMATLAEGINHLASTEEWRRYLSFQSRFHRYSFGNVLLIAAQCPGATRVAGFSTWRKMGRPVRKGEKAIWILAPMIARGAGSDPGAEPEGRVVRGFKFVPVFDLAQTDGDAIPSACNRLTGDDAAGHYATLLSVAHSLGFAVEDHRFSGSTNGDCSHSGHRIRIEAANAPAQRVKTLAHEITHALLHGHPESRARAELEAESSAYVVCRALGIDSGDYSFGYVTAWAGGRDEALAGIRASGERIQRASATILSAFEPRVAAEAA